VLLNDTQAHNKTKGSIIFKAAKKQECEERAALQLQKPQISPPSERTRRVWQIFQERLRHDDPNAPMNPEIWYKIANITYVDTSTMEIGKVDGYNTWYRRATEKELCDSIRNFRLHRGTITKTPTQKFPFSFGGGIRSVRKGGAETIRQQPQPMDESSDDDDGGEEVTMEVHPSGFTGSERSWIGKLCDILD